MRQERYFTTLYLFHLQGGEDNVDTSEVGVVEDLLLGGVGDLAVVDDDGVAVSTLTGEPADALGELDVGVGDEQLGIC